jgi:hypothetical protein
LKAFSSLLPYREADYFIRSSRGRNRDGIDGDKQTWDRSKGTSK